MGKDINNSSQRGYASFLFFKASSKTIYERTFNKVDEFFSYVGGLIGTILGLMLFMSNFSLMSFELDIAQRYFKYSHEDKMDASCFNIFSYFSYLFYKAGAFCGLCKRWKSMKKKV